MQIIDIKITDLKEYSRNAVKHPKKQIKLLAENIKKFGFSVPLIIDKNKEIIAGHGRLAALKMLGMDKAPCVMMDKLTQEEVKAMRLADNQIARMSEFEMELVIDELKGLSMQMLSLTGFDNDLLLEPENKDDEIPEVTKSNTKIGDVYQLGGYVECPKCGKHLH